MFRHAKMIKKIKKSKKNVNKMFYFKIDVISWQMVALGFLSKNN